MYRESGNKSLHEAGHKAGVAAHERALSSRGPKRTFNEAAHKLGSWKVTSEPVNPTRVGVELDAVDDERDVVAHAGQVVLALGALGVVYGDLGTSPLYTMQVIFTQHRDAAHATPAGVYGVISLIFWAMTLIVSVKYAGLLMRVHNRGDGGGMAMVALIQRRGIGRTALLVTLGIFGAGLFFGDGMITPAISVTSAVEGLKVVEPGLAHLVVPIALGILIALFAVQKKGTGAVGWLFGPLILVWFVVIAVLGSSEVIQHPGVLQALSPDLGCALHGRPRRRRVPRARRRGAGADGGRGAVRGPRPLRRQADPAHLVRSGIPSVLLSYLGQGALILAHPGYVHESFFSPFFQLVPSSLQIPMVVLATVATIIASQAAITGSFSITRQAVQLGFLPRLRISHTSDLEGQIYVPVITWVLGVGVVALVLIFKRSSALADIYGVAVTGTFVIDTILFLVVARAMWKTAIWKLCLIGGTLLVVEVSFFSANISKVSHGAWIPLGVGLSTAILMVTWRCGYQIVTRNRTEEEGDFTTFLDHLRTSTDACHRARGVAIYLSPNKSTTPLALKADLDRHGIFHERVLIASVAQLSVPHVDPAEQFLVEVLGSGTFKVRHVTVRAGYHDVTDIPAALMLARKRGLLERNLDLEHASYFLSQIRLTMTSRPGMSRWQKLLFIALARNAASPIDTYRLPVERTTTVGAMIGV